MITEANNSDRKDSPPEVDLSVCEQAGEYFRLPLELQFALRPGSTVQTSRGELLVTGEGLRCVRRVAEDILSGKIPGIHTKDAHPLISAAIADFGKKAREVGDPKPPYLRSGTRGR